MERKGREGQGQRERMGNDKGKRREGSGKARWGWSLAAGRSKVRSPWSAASDIAGRCCRGSSSVWEWAVWRAGVGTEGPYYLGSSWVGAHRCTWGPCYLGSTAVTLQAGGTSGPDYLGSSQGLGVKARGARVAGSADPGCLGSS